MKTTTITITCNYFLSDQSGHSANAFSDTRHFSRKYTRILDGDDIPGEDEIDQTTSSAIAILAAEMDFHHQGKCKFVIIDTVATVQITIR